MKRPAPNVGAALARTSALGALHPFGCAEERRGRNGALARTPKRRIIASRRNELARLWPATVGAILEGVTGEERALTKTGFLRGLQCPKALYFSAFDPLPPTPHDPASAARMATGRAVGLLARQLFPEGQAASGPPFDSVGAAERTRSLMASRAPAVFEATFRTEGGMLAAVDILARGRRGWRLIEVKSTTSVKEEHFADVAFQLHLARDVGVEIESAEVLHLNSDYIRRGELELDGLFTLVSVLPQAEALLPAVAAGAAGLTRLLGDGLLPDVRIGAHCLNPRACDYRDRCWAEVPDGSVLEIAQLSWDRKFQLFDQGIVRIEDVPDNARLPKRSRFHVAAHQGGVPIIDTDGLRSFLDRLTFPILLLDFETVAPAVPLWDGTHPYQQVPFQYSLHVLRDSKAEPGHTGFLADPGPDPRPALLANLLPATSGGGTILAYHMPFELTVMRELAEAFPEHRLAIEQRLPRMDDLIKPFRAWHYWRPEMGGSFSIKSVAPALAPELSYEGLEIADGLSASLTYERLIAGVEAAESARLRAALEVYCKRDTLAMVRVLQSIWQAAEAGVVSGEG